jgi:hypothetical protein
MRGAVALPLVADLNGLLPEGGTYVPRGGHAPRARTPFLTTEIMWSMMAAGRDTTQPHRWHPLMSSAPFLNPLSEPDVVYLD